MHIPFVTYTRKLEEEVMFDDFVFQLSFEQHW